MSDIGVKEAVRLAREYLIDLYSPEELPNLRLEEVEKSPDGSQWLVTYGFTTNDAPVTQHPLLPKGIGFGATKRDYKTITVDAWTGVILSMKIRQP